MCKLGVQGGQQRFLSEIKTLSYLDQHDNLVGFVGAHEGNRRLDKIYIFLELCELGSLHDILRRIKSNEESASQDGEHNLELINDLKNWRMEICSGMEYLASKNVI